MWTQTSIGIYLHEQINTSFGYLLQRISEGNEPSPMQQRRLDQEKTTEQILLSHHYTGRRSISANGIHLTRIESSASEC